MAHREHCALFHRIEMQRAYAAQDTAISLHVWTVVHELPRFVIILTLSLVSALPSRTLVLVSLSFPLLERRAHALYTQFSSSSVVPLPMPIAVSM